MLETRLFNLHQEERRATATAAAPFIPRARLRCTRAGTIEQIGLTQSLVSFSSKPSVKKHLGVEARRSMESYLTGSAVRKGARGGRSMTGQGTQDQSSSILDWRRRTRIPRPRKRSNEASSVEMLTGRSMEKVHGAFASAHAYLHRRERNKTGARY